MLTTFTLSLLKVCISVLIIFTVNVFLFFFCICGFYMWFYSFVVHHPVLPLACFKLPNDIPQPLQQPKPPYYSFESYESMTLQQAFEVV